MADKHEKEIDGLPRKIPFFAGLSEAERAEVRGTLQFWNFRRNDIILHEEETSRYLYLICSGKVKVLQTSAEGEEQRHVIHLQKWMVLLMDQCISESRRICFADFNL